MKKFDTIFESAMERYQRAGFLVGDRVEFALSFKNKPEYKELDQGIKDQIDVLINSGQNIRVLDIKNKYPNVHDANPHLSTNQVFLEVGLDIGGGRYTNKCILPSSLMVARNDYPNLPPIPDDIKRKNNIQIKPKPVEQDEEHITRMTDKGTNVLTRTNISLPSSNVKIPASPVSPSPAVNSYMQSLIGKN